MNDEEIRITTVAIMATILKIKPNPMDHGVTRNKKFIIEALKLYDEVQEACKRPE